MGRAKKLAWTAATVALVLLLLQLYLFAYWGFNLYAGLAWYFPELPFPDLDLTTWILLDFAFNVAFFLLVVLPLLRGRGA